MINILHIFEDKIKFLVTKGKKYDIIKQQELHDF